MNNPDKKIAIIILGYNSKQHLLDCLSSLVDLNYPKDRYGIFLFDNNSADDSVAYTKENFPQVKVIVNSENLGFAAGNNQASQYVLELGFDYVLLLNDDTISDANMLQELLTVAESDSLIGAVQARLMLWPEKEKVNSLGNKLHYLGFGFSDTSPDFNLQPLEITYGSGAALLIKREMLEKIGLFQADFFMYHEDLDFGWRARLSGYKIFLAPQAIVYHKYKFAKSIKQYYWMERNRFICLLKNYKLATLILILPALLIMEIGLFLFAIKRGFWREKLKVYTYFLQPDNWAIIKQARQQTQSLRKIKDKNVVSWFCGKITNQEIDNWLLDKIANPIFNLYWQIIKKLIIW